MFIQAFEGFAFHVDFAAHLESALRNFARVDFKLLCVKSFRNIRNRERVQRHIVALGAVAAGGRLFQAPILVHDGKRNTVDFPLADPLMRGGRSLVVAEAFDSFLGRFDELRHLFGAVHVRDAEHGHSVCDLRKVVRQVATDPLRERCIATKFRILRLERFHLLEAKVEILVAHGGDAFLVVKAARFF